MCNCIRTELGLEGWEMLHQEGRQETVFTEGKEILLMQRVNIRLSILFNNSARDYNGTTLVGCSDTIETETSRQTSDGAKQTFERFRKVVRNVVFVYLNHCP